MGNFFKCLKRRFECDNIINKLMYNAHPYDKVIKDWGTLDEMVKNNIAVDSTTSALQSKMVSQFKKPLKMQGMSFDLHKDLFFFSIANGEVRVPKAFINDLLKISPQDLWNYKTEGQPFVCSDFAHAVWGEWNNSPYSDVMFGIAKVPGHAILWAWPSDSNDILFYEPQSDGLLNITKNKYPHTMIR